MDLYGIIGRPLGHSRSPQHFNTKFRDEGIDALYLPFEIQEVEEIRQLLAQHPEMKGFNVTIPYKQSIIPFLDSISPEAAAVGAVNCVKICRTGKVAFLKGYNTDVYGFRTALLEFMDHPDGKALILGNGGAAKAVRYVCTDLGMEVITASRHPRGESLVGYDELPTILPGCRLVVNATPLGTWPETGQTPELPFSLLGSGHFLFDLVYNPPLTRFMHLGALQQARVCNGSRMLLAQAGKNWEIWQDKNL